MSARTRSSARQAARPASTAPATNAASATRTSRNKVPSSAQPDSASETRVSRRSASHDSEAEAGEPSRRGPAKKKQKQQQQRKKVTVKGARREVEAQIPSIEEEDEREAVDIGETQGTIILASAGNESEGDEDAVDADGDDSDKGSETFTDAPEVPSGAEDQARQASVALSGTTARASDVRSELNASKIIKALPDLFYKAKAVIRILTDNLDESVPEDDLEADPRFAAFESAFAACTLDEWIACADVQKLLTRSYKKPDQIPMRDRIDEPCFLANIAHLCHEINSAAVDGGLDFNTLYDLDTKFPQHFETGLTKESTLNPDVGISRLQNATIDIAIEIRTQRYIKSIVHAYKEDNLTSSKTLMQTFFHLEESDPDYRKFRGWNAPGLRDSDIKGRFKTLLTERVATLETLIDPDESSDEEGYKALQDELETQFPARDFEAKLMRWAMSRAEEIKDTFEERWNGDANALQKRLYDGLPARGPLQEIDAPNTSQETNGRDHGQRGTTTEDPEGQGKSSKVTSRKALGRQSTLDKNKIQKRRAFMEQQKNASAGPATASKTAVARRRAKDTSAAPTDDLFVPIDDYENEQDLPDEGLPARNRSADSQPTLSEHGQHFSDLRSTARQERGFVSSEPRASSAAHQRDSRAGSNRPEQARTVPSSSSKKRRRHDDVEHEVDDADSRKRQRNAKGHVPPSHRQTSGQVGDALDRQQRRDVSQSGYDSEPHAPIANQGRAIRQSKSHTPWTVEEDDILLAGIEHYNCAYGCMSKILTEFDQNKVLQRSGRKNDSLTDRARHLLFTKLTTGQDPSDSLCKIRLKPIQKEKLRRMNITIPFQQDV